MNGMLAVAVLCSNNIVILIILWVRGGDTETREGYNKHSSATRVSRPKRKKDRMLIPQSRVIRRPRRR